MKDSILLDKIPSFIANAWKFEIFNVLADVPLSGMVVF